jgi:hypothetical protein
MTSYITRSSDRNINPTTESDLTTERLAARVLAARFGMPLRRAALVAELAGIGREAA